MGLNLQENATTMKPEQIGILKKIAESGQGVSKSADIPVKIGALKNAQLDTSMPANLLPMIARHLLVRSKVNGPIPFDKELEDQLISEMKSANEVGKKMVALLEEVHAADTLKGDYLGEKAAQVIGMAIDIGLVAVLNKGEVVTPSDEMLKKMAIVKKRAVNNGTAAVVMEPREAAISRVTGSQQREAVLKLNKTSPVKSKSVHFNEQVSAKSVTSSGALAEAESFYHLEQAEKLKSIINDYWEANPDLESVDASKPDGLLPTAASHLLYLFTRSEDYVVSQEVEDQLVERFKDNKEHRFWIDLIKELKAKGKTKLSEKEFQAYARRIIPPILL